MQRFIDTLAAWYMRAFGAFQDRFSAAEQQQFELKILFVTSLVLFGVLGVIVLLLVLQRVRNNRISRRMRSLVVRLKEISGLPADSEEFKQKASVVLTPADYPYFQRYVRRHLSRNGIFEEPHLLLIARASGFNAHIARRAKQSRGWKRALALRSLSYLRNKDNIPLFRVALKSSSSHHSRYAAALGLALCGDVDSIELIIERIYHPGNPNRDQVLAVLEAYGPAACGPVSKLLASDEYCGTIRTVFLDFLRVQKYGQAEPDILALLEADIEDEVLVHAVETLGVVGSCGAVPVVERYLRHDYFVIRLKALTALARLDGDRALRHLDAALQDDDWWVRRNAAEAIISCNAGGEQVLEKAAEAAATPRGRTAAMVLDEWRAGKQRLRFRYG